MDRIEALDILVSRELSAEESDPSVIRFLAEQVSEQLRGSVIDVVETLTPYARPGGECDIPCVSETWAVTVAAEIGRAAASTLLLTGQLRALRERLPGPLAAAAPEVGPALQHAAVELLCGLDRYGITVSEESAKWWTDEQILEGTTWLQLAEAAKQSGRAPVDPPEFLRG